MINIAELLKEAPKDMKLYSPLFGEVEFCAVDTADSTIVVRTGHGNKEWFSMTGKYKINKSHFLYSDSECLLFPSKECRTWENFELPVKPNFKVGDWITDGTCKVKITDINNTHYWYSKNCILGEIESINKKYHLWTIQDAKDGDILIDEATHTIGIFEEISKTHWRSKIYCGNSTWGSLFHNGGLHATEATKPAIKEQRDLLFQKMKEEGYKWDAEKKELRNIINPKFKVGDDIKTGNTIDTIAEVGYATRSYYCESGRTIYFANQDLWHLVSEPHYDIANFYAGMPVLVREYDTCHWQWVQYSHFNGVGLFFAAGKTWRQCIPFEGNEHLLGTTDMPSEEFINW